MNAVHKFNIVPRFTVHRANYGSTRLQAPWSISVSCRQESTIYVVLGNGAWFNAPSVSPEPFWCPPGSSMSITRGAEHSWRSDLNQPLSTVVDNFPVTSPRMVTNVPFPASGETTMLAGHIPLTELRAFLLVTPLLYIPPEDPTMEKILKNLARIDIIMGEPRSDFSTNAIIQRLSEIMVIDNARFWMRNAPDRYAYPLIGMEDRHIHSALAALHAKLDHKWTTDQLAGQANLSRSAFAVRFKRLTGMAPLEYLTLVRLRKAALLMRDSRSTLAGIALSVGYRSEAAFIRAFRREFKMTPGEYKRAEPHLLPGAA